MRFTLVILLLSQMALGQSLLQKLAAPIFYELAITPAYQSNPLNLSELEIERAGVEPEYLNGIDVVSSNVLSFQGTVRYEPSLIGGRKTRLLLRATHHAYTDIEARSYQSFYGRIKQSMGNYRYLTLSYSLLPSYYLRNYLDRDPASQILTREVCEFGTDRLAVAWDQRISKKNDVGLVVSRRLELYGAPFQRFDLNMLEGELSWSNSTMRALPFTLSLQYGEAYNDNELDDIDRSYSYLNLRPTVTARLPGKHRLRLSARYDQRAYHAESLDDPLHGGRFQEEFRVDVDLLPRLKGPVDIEPFLGMRVRNVDSVDPDVGDLKSFRRYWFGVNLAFSSVIDMYF